MKTCTFEDCNRKHQARGLCKAHWQQMRRGTSLLPVRAISPKGSQVGICSVDGCDNPKKSIDLCNHHGTLARQGKPLVAFKKRTGRSLLGNGYVKLSGHREHPNSHKDGGIFEHVFVMSNYLGRPLLPHENVHHINGVRDDNRIENLELWSKSQPAGQRVEDKLKWCREFLAQYSE